MFSMAEHRRSAIRKAYANIPKLSEEKPKEVAKVIIHYCRNCGNMLRKNVEIKDGLCNECKEKK